jgi:hypothetical protein
VNFSADDTNDQADVRDVERRPWGKSFLKPKGPELESGRVFLFVLDLLPRFTYVNVFIAPASAGGL